MPLPFSHPSSNFKSEVTCLALEDISAGDSCLTLSNRELAVTRTPGAVAEQ